jgi:hypothetical protein
LQNLYTFLLLVPVEEKYFLTLLYSAVEKLVLCEIPYNCLYVAGSHSYLRGTTLTLEKMNFKGPLKHNAT